MPNSPNESIKLRAQSPDRTQRLFYLEEVEEIRVANFAVYAGRRLHEEIVPLDDESPERRSMEVASEFYGLMGKTDRPPVTANENLCIRCSLAPVCLPEEERLAPDLVVLNAEAESSQPVLDAKKTESQVVKKAPRLFPSLRQKQTLHVCANKSRIGRSSETLVVTSEDENRKEIKQTIPIEEIDSVVIHGYGQITTQAIHLCSYHGVAARAYFASLPAILSSNIPLELVPKGRSKHPPLDRFNALLSYGYSLLYGLVERTALSVGLEPSFGFYHRPRSSAPPLVMDVMELFRTNIWEIPLVGSINRMQWDIDHDFTVTSQKVWLSDSGRRKAITIFEERLNETHVHPHTGQSLAYARMVELELRLLEKEWTGHPGLFAKLRLR